jgi:glyoxylase-like metal-dependent hydrolase (beta-lactamase superfamily II)
MTVERHTARHRGHAGPTFFRNVVPGVHRLEHAYVNVYLLEDQGRLTIVDTGFPSTWRLLPAALASIGREFSDIEAVVLTHAHFDHVGFAARADAELGVPIYVHNGDRALAAHPYRYRRERSPLLYPFIYPSGIPAIVSMVAAGALIVRGVTDVRELRAGQVLDVPGNPVAVATPGHTFGHCALHLPGRDAVISGDALVTLDPYKGASGSQIVAGAATADSAMALSALDALAATDASSVLPGHGDPWHGGVRAAVAAARAVGAT